MREMGQRRRSDGLRRSIHFVGTGSRLFGHARAGAAVQGLSGHARAGAFQGCWGTRVLARPSSGRWGTRVLVRPGRGRGVCWRERSGLPVGLGEELVEIGAEAFEGEVVDSDLVVALQEPRIR